MTRSVPIFVHGYPVMLSRHLTRTVTVERRRTWIERLTTWPWRPWQATRTVHHATPDHRIYLVPGSHGDYLLMHPMMWTHLQDLDNAGWLSKQHLAELVTIGLPSDATGRPLRAMTNWPGTFTHKQA